MEELCKLAVEYDNIVNPFGDKKLKLKESTEYWDKAQVGLGFNDKGTHFSINSDAIATSLHVDSTGWSYKTLSGNNEGNGYTNIIHYFENGNDGKSIDEVIYLSYSTGDDYSKKIGDIDLRISLKTGLAWKSYHEEEAKPATKKQIKTMMLHLKRDIEKVKRNIINHMVDAKTSC